MAKARSLKNATPLDGSYVVGSQTSGVPVSEDDVFIGPKPEPTFTEQQVASIGRRQRKRERAAKDASGDTPITPMFHRLKMDKRHRYTCDCGVCAGKVYRSVTTILNRAVPKDLSWWGMTIGAEAVKALHELGYDLSALTDTEVVEAIKAEKLTVRDRMGQAADRGTSVHKALEDYGNDGRLPDLSEYPESSRGYVRGVTKFLATYQPEIVASEVQVVSVEHEFAGTYDFEANIRGRVEDVKGKRVFTPDPAASTFTLGDLKTSKWVYPTSHFAQLEAYERARVENGRTPTDVRAVLHVTATGGMWLVPSTFTFDDFLTLKRSAEVVERGDREGRQLRKAVTG